jgi:hypothetical protein
VDAREDFVRLLKDLVVPKSQHAKALRCEPGRTSSIASNVRGVLAAIELDDETAFQAGKVGSVRTDRDLPAKAMTVDLLPTKACPEMPFGIGGLAT